MSESICFVIAHRYNRNYVSYIKYYVDNVIKYYKNSKVVIVDNNSPHIEDIKEKFMNYNNVTIIENTSEYKFELGAYQYGIKYIFENKLYSDYYVFTQDTFILKNKYNFGELAHKNIQACPIYGGYNDYFSNIHVFSGILEPILEYVNLNKKEALEKFCVHNSFILHHNVLDKFIELTKHIKIITKLESQTCERYLAAILYTLNNNIYYDIDGDFRLKKYNEFKINPYIDIVAHYFIKRIQNKTESISDNTLQNNYYDYKEQWKTID
jgi:hypothetical protein